LLYRKSVFLHLVDTFIFGCCQFPEETKGQNLYRNELRFEQFLVFFVKLTLLSVLQFNFSSSVHVTRTFASDAAVISACCCCYVARFCCNCLSFVFQWSHPWRFQG